MSDTDPQSRAALAGEADAPAAAQPTTDEVAAQLQQDFLDERRKANRLLTILAVMAITYTLAIAKVFLIPLALAFLLSLALAPVVRWMQRMRIPRALGAAIVVIALLTGIGFGVNSAIDPVSEWFQRAPTVLSQLEQKINPIRETVEEVSKTADQVDRMTSMGEGERTVEIKELSFREAMYGRAQGLIAGTVMVTFLLYFTLSWGRVILVRVAGLLEEHRGRHRFLELSTILEGEVSKYLFTITLINSGLGVVVAGVLFMLGVPNAVLWGAVAALFNFVPYLGSLVTATLLGITSLLTFDDLSTPALVVAAFMGVTTFEGQIVTPLILGRQLALNPLVVFLSVLFWFWLWGIPGALMAVPMLITLKLIGDRVDALRPLAVIAGR